VELDAEEVVEVKLMMDDDDDVDDAVNHLLLFLFHRLIQHEHRLEDDHR
jgi:hypothetical protein